jgi:hypothetical protein
VVSRRAAHAWPPCVLPIIAIVNEGEIDVVVFGLATDTQPPGLDAREDDAHEFAEGSRVEGDDTVGSAALCVFGVDAIARYGCLCGAANRA